MAGCERRGMAPAKRVGTMHLIGAAWTPRAPRSLASSLANLTFLFLIRPSTAFGVAEPGGERYDLGGGPTGPLRRCFVSSLATLRHARASLPV